MVLKLQYYQQESAKLRQQIQTIQNSNRLAAFSGIFISYYVISIDCNTFFNI